MRCFTGPASSPRESSSLAVAVKVSLPPFFTNCRAKGSTQHSGFPYFAELSGSAVSSDAFDVHPSPNSDIPSCWIDSLLLKLREKCLVSGKTWNLFILPALLEKMKKWALLCKRLVKCKKEFSPVCRKQLLKKFCFLPCCCTFSPGGPAGGAAGLCAPPSRQHMMRELRLGGCSLRSPDIFSGHPQETSVHLLGWGLTRGWFSGFLLTLRKINPTFVSAAGWEQMQVLSSNTNQTLFRHVRLQRCSVFKKAVNAFCGKIELCSLCFSLNQAWSCQWQSTSTIHK